MKIITANRLRDGRVIYLGENGMAVDSLGLARLFDDQAALAALERVSASPAVFVNPYTVEVEVPEGGNSGLCLLRPSGRDRLKETIRSDGPTVGNSLRTPLVAILESV
jgi:hypothetical protein